MPESSVMKSKKNKTKRSVGFMVGSVAFYIGMFVVILKAAPYVSGVINKRVVKIKNAKKSDDDWGPIIEKRLINNDEEE